MGQKQMAIYITTDYRKWLTEEGLHNCVVSTPELSAKDLVDFCNYASKELLFESKISRL